MPPLRYLVLDYLRQGGAFIILLQLPIAVILSVTMLERFIRLFLIYPRRLHPFLDTMGRLHAEGQLEAATTLANRWPSSLLTRMNIAVIRQLPLGPVAVNATLIETMLEFRSLLTRRLELIRGLAYVGLLSTPLSVLVGRVAPSCQMGLATPEAKFALLARGTLEDMAGSVGWCLIGLVGLAGVAMLEARARRLHDDLQRMEARLRSVLELDPGPARTLIPVAGVARAMARRRARLFLSNPPPGQASLILLGRLPGMAGFAIVLLCILAFMLRVYTTTPAVNLTPGLNPPVSNARLPMREAITVAITPTEIVVDDKKVASLEGGGPSAGPLSALEQMLASRKEYHLKIEALGGPTFDGRLLLIVDRGGDVRHFESGARGRVRGGIQAFRSGGTGAVIPSLRHVGIRAEGGPLHLLDVVDSHAHGHRLGLLAFVERHCRDRGHPVSVADCLCPAVQVGGLRRTQIVDAHVHRGGPVVRSELGEHGSAARGIDDRGDDPPV